MKMTADNHLFESKYGQYKDTLFRIAFTYLKNIEDCEDVLQEVFIKYMGSLSKFSSDEHEKRWLIRATINMCKNHLNLFWNKNRVQADSLEMFGVSSGEERVLDEVLALPDKYKAVIYLHYIEGYKVEEIAGILKIGGSAVKMRLKKGRELLRMEYEEDGYERK